MKKLLPLIADGHYVVSTLGSSVNGGYSICEAFGPTRAASREHASFIVTACNAHDQLVAENAALRADLNDARSNWESGAEELRQADLVREQLVAALRRLEDANDTICGLRTSAQYLSMIDGGQKDALTELDTARSEARVALLAAGAAP